MIVTFVVLLIVAVGFFFEKNKLQAVVVEAHEKLSEIESTAEGEVKEAIAQITLLLKKFI